MTRFLIWLTYRAASLCQCQVALIVRFSLHLFSLVDNVKSDRTAEALLFQVMLELGATLDSKIATEVVAGKTIYNVAFDGLSGPILMLLSTFSYTKIRNTIIIL